MADTIRINKVIRERIDLYREEQRKNYEEYAKDDKRWEKELLLLESMSDIDLIEQALWMAIAGERNIRKS